MKSGYPGIDRAVPYLLLMLVVALAYGNGVGGGFIWDDDYTVVNNLRTHGLSHIPALFGWGDARFGYRLMRDLSYTFDYSVGGGLNPVVYHLFNIIYHGVVTVLLFVLARRLTGSAVAAMWGALLFAVHPVHTDVVTYISGRRDLLSALFYLAGVLAFIRFRDCKRWGWMALAAGCGVLGVLSKEMAATLPAAWFMVDVWRAMADGLRLKPAAGRVLAAHWRMYGGGFALVCAFAVYVVVFQLGSLPPPHGGSWASNFMTEAVVLAYGVKLLVLPTSLMLDYRDFFTPVVSFFEPRFLFSAGFLLAVLIPGIYLLRGRPAALFALLWCGVSYLPVMQIIPHAELFAEHYLYLPSVGACMLGGMAIAAASGAGGGGGRAATVAGAVMVLALGVGTWDRNRDFESQITVLEAQIYVHPNNWRAQANLAHAYEEAGRLSEARAAWIKSVTLHPASAVSWTSFGTLLRNMGSPMEAVAAYRRAVQVNPKHLPGWNGLGIALQQTGDLDGAAKAFRRVGELNPHNGEAWNNIGVLHVIQRQWDEAEAAFVRAVNGQKAPGSAYLNLARIRLSKGDCEAARSLVGRAVSETDMVLESPPVQQMIGSIQAVCSGTRE